MYFYVSIITRHSEDDPKDQNEETYEKMAKYCRAECTLLLFLPVRSCVVLSREIGTDKEEDGISGD